MSHPALIYPVGLELFPSEIAGEPLVDTFDLRVLYQGSLDWQHLMHVRISERAQVDFDRGEVRGFSIASVEASRSASSACGRACFSVVTGVELRSGTRYGCVPQSLTRAYRRQILRSLYALMATLASIALSHAGFAAVGGALMLDYLRDARTIPRKPAWE